MTMIHATAIVEPGAELGADVQVGPFSVVHAGVQIGDRCRIGPHVTVFPHTIMDADCRVHAGAVLGDQPQDLGFKDTVSYLKIGVGCTIREGVTLHRGTAEESATVIGEGCFLMAFSHCGHNVCLGNGVIVANGVLFAGHVTVGDGAFISGNCLVHQFCRIGRLAMLGGGCGVSKDVPPFCTTHPVALNRIAALNTVGMRRAGLTGAQRLEIKQAYRHLYHGGLNFVQALGNFDVECPGAISAEIAAFVRDSKRGICPWGGEDIESGAER